MMLTAVTKTIPPASSWWRDSGHLSNFRGSRKMSKKGKLCHSMTASSADSTITRHSPTLQS
jgi:hypothetical protein